MSEDSARSAKAGIRWVRVTDALEVAATPVTEAQYRAHPSHPSNCEEYQKHYGRRCRCEDYNG